MDVLSLSQEFWIAAHVKTSRELSVSAALNEKGYETFVPCYRLVRRWSDRQKIQRLPLIAGYVFVRGEQDDAYGPIATTPGVIRMLAFGRQVAAIDDAEIQRLRLVSESPLKTEPWPYLRRGAKVTIHDGPLSGIAGIVISDKGKTLLVVSIEMMRRSVAVHIERSSIAITPADFVEFIDPVGVPREPASDNYGIRRTA